VGKKACPPGDEVSILHSQPEVEVRSTIARLPTKKVQWRRRAKRGDATDGSAFPSVFSHLQQGFLGKKLGKGFSQFREKSQISFPYYV